MIKLGNREPFWLDLADGVRLQVRPITTPAYAMIQAQAEKVFEDWAANRAEAEGLDPADQSVRRGLIRAMMIKGLALYAIIAWQGIDAPVTNDAVAAFIDENPLLVALFYHRYLAPLIERAAEGNASGPAPHGISAAGQDIAKPVTEPAAMPAPTANMNP
jgi:hypothetical protein